MDGLKTTSLSVLPKGAPVQVTEGPDITRVSVPAGQTVTLVEKYQNHVQEPYSTQAKIQVDIAPGSKVTHYKLVLEGRQATHQSFIEVDAGHDAAFYSHVFLMSGAKIRNTI